jgi:hypothetical protein
MPGARLRSYRLGDRSEQLVEFLLSAFAFTTPVPRQEDIGFDFLCSLISTEGQLLKAGQFFTVQAKSAPDPLIFEKDHEVAWITGQENPLLLCVADRGALAMDVYSTWNLLCGYLSQKPRRIILLPGVSGGMWPGVDFKPDGTQEIRLGDPIARLSVSEVFNEAKVKRVAAVINDWLALDRLNIVNNQAGMHWVRGPLTYTTGELPYAEGTGGISFYWNPNNLDKCSANLGRVATALALLYRDCVPDGEKTKEPWSGRILALNSVVQSHRDLFDEPVNQFLIHVGLGPK